MQTTFILFQISHPLALFTSLQFPQSEAECRVFLLKSPAQGQVAEVGANGYQQMPLGPWLPFVSISADSLPPTLILPGIGLQITGRVGPRKGGWGDELVTRLQRWERR